MSISAQLNTDMKTALKARDKKRLGAIRLIIAAIKQIEIDEQISVDDGQALQILTKLAKQRRESITQYEKAQRGDLVEQEQFELGIINAYLPQPFSEEEIIQLIQQVIAEQGAQSIQDMGKVMAALQTKMQGRADMAKVSQHVKNLFKPSE